MLSNARDGELDPSGLRAGEYLRSPSVQATTAVKGSQQSLEIGATGHGIFTKVLCDGL